MSIIPAQTLRRLCIERSTPMIEPFHERQKAGGMTFGLSPAGYDVRIAQDITLAPGKFVLASTIEGFCMPDNIIGFVHDKSTWARQGVAVQNTVIEPGWRGQSLTLEISNHGSGPVQFRKGHPIAQIVFHRLEQPTSQPYEGRYQDQEPGPQGALFEREDVGEVPADIPLCAAAATQRIIVTEQTKFDEPTAFQCRVLPSAFLNGAFGAQELLARRLVALLVCMDAPRRRGEESLLSEISCETDTDGYMLEGLAQHVDDMLRYYEFPVIAYASREDAMLAMYGPNPTTALPPKEETS